MPCRCPSTTRRDFNRANSARSRSSSGIADRATAHVVVAPDKFKGSLTAREASDAIARGLARVWPAREIVRLPMADGGEGTVDAFLDAGWTRVSCIARGPYGEARDAAFAFRASERTAVVEMCAASGPSAVAEHARDPLRASTLGTGDLVRAALDRGAERIVVGLGGSATNDGGAGFLTALGVRLLDGDGRDLPPGGAALGMLAAFDLRALDPRVRGVAFTLAADVDAPLAGERGASLAYGPQKGATVAQARTLDVALAHFADVVAATTGVDVRARPGAGAAGGLGFALLAFCRATFERGADLVADARGLDGRLARAAWCFTGEGSLDAQTLAGKTVAAVAARARAAGVPAIAFAGEVDARVASVLAARGAVGIRIAPPGMTRDESMTRAGALLEDAASRFARGVPS